MLRNLMIFGFVLCFGSKLYAQNSFIVDSLNHALDNATTDSAVVMLKTQLAREYIYVDIGKANDLVQEAMILADEKGLLHERAYTMRIMGSVLRQNGFYLQGAELLLQAKAIFHDYNDMLGVANCNMSLSHVYDLLGDHSLSLDVSFEALDIYKALDKQEREGVIYNNIGRSYFDIGKLDSASIYTRKSIKINEAIGNYPLLESNYRNLGLILVELDFLDSAKNYFHKVLDIHDTLGEQSNKWATSESYMSLARIALEEGDHTQVPIYLKQSSDLASAYSYLDVLKQLMQISFRYYDRINDHEGLMNAWDRYLLITDSLLKFERENKRDIVSWYEERLQKESQIIAINTRVGKQRTQIITLAIIVGLAFALLVMFINNIQKEKRVNNLLQEQKDELERLNETKNKLFSIVAHDFRGPVSQVYAFSSLLEKHIDSLKPDELRKVAEDMNRSVKNTLTLTENLLSWARNQMDGGATTQPKDINLKSLLENIVEAHQDQASRKAINLVGNFADDLNVYADPEELEVVFRNLITNAIKFSTLDNTVIINARRNQSEVVVEVKDEGIGMDEKTKSSLFDLSKKSGVKGTAGELGTGLGLVICKEFVDQNNGKITVQSEEGKGSAFTVSFPLS